MKGGIFAFFAGIGVAATIGALRSKGFAPRVAAGLTTLDLNSGDATSFQALGIDPELADRIVENRPYRNKLELIERYVIGKVDYDRIKHRISTDAGHANDPVRVAG